jgi:hypothetical protein
MAINFPNSPTNGQTHAVGSFTWQYDGEKWVAANGIALDGLSDVTAPTPTSGDFLKWNGTAWVNDAIDLGTDTSGSFVASLVAGTGVTLTGNTGEAATPTVAVDTTVIAPLASPTFTGTVAGITKSMVGLGNVDNTSDANKPVSTAGQTALDLKANLASPTFTGTVTTNNLTVSGNLTIDDNIIVLNNDTTGAPSQDVGVEVERGSSANVQLRWNETNDKWQFTNDGTNYTDLGAGGATISSTAPTSPDAGAIWFDSDTAQTYVYYDSSWIEIGSAGGGARMFSSSSAPSSPLEGQLWFDSDTAQTFIYYDSQWIEIGASAMGATVSNTPPNDPISGQLWFNSLTGGTYVYYGTNWIEIGASPFSSLINNINAKGDLLVGTADNTIGGLTAGSANQVLTVDSSTATGLKWSTPTEYASTGKAIAMAIVFGG